MASEEDHTVYPEEDLDEDDDDDSEDDVEDDDDDDTSSSNLAAGEFPPSSAVVTVAVPGVPVTPTQGIGGVTVAASVPDPKRQRIEDATIIAAAVEEKKPLALLDDSRRLFQRLWTDEDEIELLQGFLNYTTQRGVANSSHHHHHDTAAFYDQIKSKLQLDFNKNQLVEKLRRLKKKYRNVVTKIDSGKEFSFKSPHDQATFEISRQIWSADAVRGGGVLEDEESNPNPSPNPNAVPIQICFDQTNNGVNTNSSEKKTPRPRKRSRGVKIEEKQEFTPQPHQNSTPIATSIPNLIEETVRSCLSPLFKELLQNATNGPFGPRGFGGVAAAALNPMPLSFGTFNLTGGGSDSTTDERWRKQQILELEVYSKRLELVQDQIKLSLEELRSMGS